MQKPRLSSEVEHFPYGFPGVVCYFVMQDGELRQCANRDDIRRAVREARAGLATLYCAWPGEWRTDLFLVDDLDKFAEQLTALTPTIPV